MSPLLSAPINFCCLMLYILVLRKYLLFSEWKRCFLKLCLCKVLSLFFNNAFPLLTYLANSHSFFKALWYAVFDHSLLPHAFLPHQWTVSYPLHTYLHPNIVMQLITNLLSSPLDWLLLEGVGQSTCHNSAHSYLHRTPSTWSSIVSPGHIGGLMGKEGMPLTFGIG